MRRRERERLQDIVSTAEQLASVVAEGREVFDTNWQKQRVVEYSIVLIGEAVSGLPASFRVRYDHISWSDATASRNRLVHGYFDLDPNRVWRTATNVIPAFAQQIRELLDDFDDVDGVEEKQAAWPMRASTHSKLEMAAPVSPARSPQAGAVALLKPREVAEKLAVSPRTVYLWMEEGRLPSVRLSERVTRVPADAVEALMTAVTRTAAVKLGAPAPSERLWKLLEDKRDEIITIVERNKGTNVRVFGSVVRGDATEESDIDLIFDADPEMSLVDLDRLESKLSDLLGIKVDLGTADSLRVGIRERVLVEAVPL